MLFRGRGRDRAGCALVWGGGAPQVRLLGGTVEGKTCRRDHEGGGDYKGGRAIRRGRKALQREHVPFEGRGRRDEGRDCKGGQGRSTVGDIGGNGVVARAVDLFLFVTS